MLLPEHSEGLHHLPLLHVLRGGAGGLADGGGVPRGLRGTRSPAAFLKTEKYHCKKTLPDIR